MDLRTWVAAEHADVATRYSGSIASIVPRDRLKERAGDVGSSIASLVFHTHWHADIAMSAIVMAQPPVLQRHRDDLGLAGFAPARGLPEAEDVELVAALDLDALEAYRSEVQQLVADYIATITPADLDEVPDSGNRMVRIGGLDPEDVPWLRKMWDGRPASWFLQWEATGHIINHVGEMVAVRNRFGLSPF
jgi:hypothetical protein